MRFDWVNILATVIFVSIVVTLILAVASYFAYKVRESRQPRNAALDDPKFFNEYRPETATGASASASSTTTSTTTTRV
jgi:heme/copper-type cytochrome/quinol oxidase subunit 2